MEQFGSPENLECPNVGLVGMTMKNQQYPYLGGFPNESYILFSFYIAKLSSVQRTHIWGLSSGPYPTPGHLHRLFMVVSV